MLEEEKRKILLINEALVVREQSSAVQKFDNEQFKLKMKKKLANNA